MNKRGRCGGGSGGNARVLRTCGQQVARQGVRVWRGWEAQPFRRRCASGRGGEGSGNVRVLARCNTASGTAQASTEDKELLIVI